MPESLVVAFFYNEIANPPDKVNSRVKDKSAFVKKGEPAVLMTTL